MKFLRVFGSFNWALVLPPVFLTGMGLFSIYSSSVAKGGFLDFKKQLVFFAVSIFLVILLSFSDLRFLRTNSYLVIGLYVFCLLALLGLLFFGETMRGVKGWYRFGFLTLDPKPFLAVVLIIVLSKYFAGRHIEIKRIQPLLVSGIYVFFPICLVLLEPDLGSSLCLLAVWLGTIIFSGIRLRHFLLLTLIFILIFALGWKFWLKDYQKQRLLSFLNPQFDKQGISWSVNQSKIAIGSGGFLGKGIGNGSQTQYGFLSAPKTDFIFSAIAEEFGILGSSAVFLALIFLFWRVIKIAFLSQNNFSRLFAQGFAFLILSQGFINIGMCLGLFPVVGIPLPFVSYGGSQLLAFYSGLGVLMALERRG